VEHRPASDYPIGGFRRRLAALALDLLIYMVLGGLIDVTLLSQTSSVSGLSYMLGYLLMVVALLAYWVIAQAMFGRTFGKWLLRLRVVGPDGGPPGWTRALIRNLVLGSPSLLLALMGVFIAATGMFFTDESVAIAVHTAIALLAYTLLAQVAFTASRGRPSIHDRLAGTRVILLPRRYGVGAARLSPST
jgi:uncharacterized RDD family membrane protein YckC